MNKTLVNSEKEYMDLFSNFDPGEIESLLDIEFAFVDGTYRADWIKGVEIDEQQEIDASVYRKYDESVFPESYPCVVVHYFDDDYDLYGKIKFRLFDLVYPIDFKKEF